VVASPKPRMRSRPRVMEWPDPGCQQSPQVNQCLDLVRYFQNTKAVLVVTVSVRRQMETVYCDRYLSLIIKCITIVYDYAHLCVGFSYPYLCRFC
jgi:hypothetical protein